MIYIAIDSDLSGAVAAIDDAAQLILVADLPVVRIGRLAWVDSSALTDLLISARNGRPARIAVERSPARPTQGVSSAFTAGCVLGSILAACQRIAAPLDLVVPAAWKSNMGFTPQATWSLHKSAFLDSARLQFPTARLHRRKHHRRAQALLLAEYSRRQWVGKAVA